MTDTDAECFLYQNPNSCNAKVRVFCFRWFNKITKFRACACASTRRRDNILPSSGQSKYCYCSVTIKLNEQINCFERSSYSCHNIQLFNGFLFPKYFLIYKKNFFYQLCFRYFYDFSQMPSFCSRRFFDRVAPRIAKKSGISLTTLMSFYDNVKKK